VEPYRLVGFHRMMCRILLPFGSIALVLLCLVALCLDQTVLAKPQAQTATTATFVLELAEPPVSQIFAAQRASAVNAAALAAATQAQLAQVEAAQQALLAPLAALGGEVIYRNQRVYNGIALRIDPSLAGQLADLPGIKALHRLLPKVPLNANSVPAIGAPALWQGVNGVGLTGVGRTIAIIDTGIDYLHTDFGGPGTGYDEHDVTLAGDIAGFPSAKILSGYDFTGDAYNADPESVGFNPVLAPDPDPMDCYPHGTAVAGTAAGYGVNADGSTYQGPYNTATNFAALRIGPGVAPEAGLYALKVFGCAGSSEVVDQAIEWAIDPNGDGDLLDHAHVINLSLGSPYGSQIDMTTVAAENAVAAGVIVVAAAGNSGDTTYVVSSPSVGDQTISVAALGEAVAAFSSRGPRRGASALKPDLAAPGVSILTAAAGTGQEGRTVSGTSFAAPHVAGAMALLGQLHPDWSPAELKALVINTANPAPTALRYSPVRLGAGRIDLPRAAAATTLAAAADGAGLVSLSFGAPDVLTSASLQKNIRITNQLTAPVSYTLEYGGVIDAPGVTVRLPVTTVTVAANGVATLPIQLQAEAAAMRRSRDATLTPTQLNQPRHWLSEESGYLRIWPAMEPLTLTLDSKDGGASQVVVQLDYAPGEQRLQYVLTSTTPVTFTELALHRREDVTASPLQVLFVEPKVSGPDQPIAGNASLEEPAIALLAADQLALTVQLAGLDAPRQVSILLPAPVIHLPLYAAPRPASSMQTSVSQLTVGTALTATHSITLTGVELTGTQPPTDVVALVSAVELHATSPRLTPDGGERAQRGFGDLHAVGVTAALTASQPLTTPGATLYFALATYEPWATPNEVEFNVWIDKAGDGQAEFLLFNSNAANYNSRSTNDVLITALRDLRTNGVTPVAPLNGLEPTTYDTALYNSRVMLLPVPVSALGVTAAQPVIYFRVESYSDDLPINPDGTRQLIDSTEWLRYDLAHPALRYSVDGQRGPTFLDQRATKLIVDFNAPHYFGSTAGGIVLLHHHNVSALQTEVIAIDASWRATTFLPLVQPAADGE
jgi:subtilisin family serine protease